MPDFEYGNGIGIFKPITNNIKEHNISSDNIVMLQTIDKTDFISGKINFKISILKYQF